MIKLNGETLPVTIFPDNTSQVWHLPNEVFQASSAHIIWQFSHESEFMQIAQLKHLLDARGVKASLELTYLPDGRQDKPVSNDTTFALRTFAQLLNTLLFTEVSILDPHSEIAMQMIERSNPIYPKEEVYRVFAEVGDLVCYPDAGARTKYARIYSNLPFIYGEKVRQQENGQIVNYQLVGSATGKRILIVDDICDGGATFITLAAALLKDGATEVSLFVSHGLFSKGTRVLFNSGIKRVFTRNQEVGPRYFAD